MMTSATEPAVVTMAAQEIRQRLANLRRQIAPYHDAVERRVDLLGRVGSSARYVRLLARLYGFYEPLETQLDRAVARWGLPFDSEARRKAPLIATDLSTMGVTSAAVDALPRCAGMSWPASRHSALGCLYVVEGATLGGQLVARHVEQRLGFGPRSGASFFHGYGADTGRRWRTFCSVLAAECGSAVADQAILAGALDMFVAFDHWLAEDDAPCRAGARVASCE